MLKSLRILQIKDFRSLWMGQSISQFGDAMYMLVFLFMVDRLTKDPRMVGAVMAVQALPVLLLSPYAGTLADRLDRRLIMLWSDLLSAVVLFGFAVALAIQSPIPVWSIFVVAISLSTINVFFLPAKSASIPRLVPSDRIQEATSLSYATQNFMPLIGLAVSSGVLAGINRISPNFFFISSVVLNALTFIGSAAFIAKLPSILPSQADGSDSSKSTWGEARAGFDYVRKNPILKGTVLLNLISSFFIAPFMIVYIEVNRSWFGGEYWTLASFEISFVGMMVLASLWVGPRRFARPTLLASGAIAIVGVFVMLMGLATSYWPFLVLNLLCGIFLPFNLPLNALLQELTEDAFRGRVHSLNAMASSISVPLANGIAGGLMAKVGAPPLFAIMGGGLVFAALIVLLNRDYRKLVHTR